VEVEGARARVRLVTDYSVRSYGFDIDRYAYWIDGGDPAPYELDVFPDQMVAIAGQRCVLLVQLAPDVADDDGSEVNISAQASAAQVTVQGQVLTPTVVTEVEVIPEASSAGTTVTATISGDRKGLARTAQVDLEIVDPYPDDFAGVAARMRDLFIPYLETHHPNLGITSTTQWTGTIVNPRFLVVMHYLFFTDTWEMGVWWHGTIEPHDWAKIYLRRRFAEMAPSYGFKIDSVMGGDDPHPETPPDQATR
jgi:hypothetical protein